MVEEKQEEPASSASCNMCFGCYCMHCEKELVNHVLGSSKALVCRCIWVGPLFVLALALLLWKQTPTLAQVRIQKGHLPSYPTKGLPLSQHNWEYGCVRQIQMKNVPRSLLEQIYFIANPLINVQTPNRPSVFSLPLCKQLIEIHSETR